MMQDTVDTVALKHDFWYCNYGTTLKNKNGGIGLIQLDWAKKGEKK